MDLKDLQNKLNKIANSPDKIQKALFLGVKSVQSEMSVRIFQEGQAVSGSITPYKDNKELWVSDKSLRKKGDHKGKPNKDGKSKTIKTTYFENYSTLKAEQVGTSKPNMRLTNDLQNDFNNAPVIENSNQVSKVSIKVSQLSKNKIDGQHERTGQDIFKMNHEEKELFKRVVIFEIRKELLNA